MKKCSMCKQVKEFSSFAKATSTNDGYQRGCRECKNAQYLRNSGKYKAGSREARVRRAKKLAELKTHPCVDCEKSYPPYVMDFDHLGEKKANISWLMSRKSWQAILEEIEKCELVCANCHRVRTYQRNTLDGTSCWVVQ